MLIKTGNITLTDDERIQIKNGEIPERISRSWPDVTLSDLLSELQATQQES